ncbi:MAG TPA: hypothetical protein VF171_04435, partial [Trueperaceae bacterium]
MLILGATVCTQALAAGAAAPEEITASSLLRQPVVRTEIEAAWNDAQVHTDQAHEEGGWIYRSTKPNGQPAYLVKRWPSGKVCSRKGGCGITPNAPRHYDGYQLIAEFHIHPIPEVDANGHRTGFIAGPSHADIEAVQDMELLGIVRNEFGYDAYNGLGCGPNDGCDVKGRTLALEDLGMPTLAQSGEASRASAYQAP